METRGLGGSSLRWVQTTRARARAWRCGSFVCGRAYEPRYKPQKPNEPRTRVASQCFTVNMEWTNDVTLQLISEYEKHVVLWEEISKELGISVAEVKKKMNDGRN